MEEKRNQVEGELAEQLAQFEPADMYILCRKLLKVRWANVPEYKVFDAVEGGLLVPFRYVEDETGHVFIEKCGLPTAYDTEYDVDRINMELAEEDGVMFSLANVLLLEHMYPRHFPTPQKPAEKLENPYDVIAKLMADKEEISFNASVMRGKLEDAENRLSAEMRDANSVMRYTGRMRFWLDEANAERREGCRAPACDGYGFPLWLCQQRREGKQDAETAKMLHEGFGHSQSSAIFMVKLPEEFKEELDALKAGKPITNEARRGDYRSLLDGTSRARKKFELEKQKKKP